MINFKNVTIKIEHKIILKNINISLAKNEKVFIIGSSGVGKTTLFNSIIDNKMIKKGTLIYQDKNVREFKNKKMIKSIGFITQRDYFLEWESVYYNIKNLYPKYKTSFYEFFNIINSKQKKEIKTIARKLGIEKLLFKKISEISGGERQRIKILLLLLKSPSLILADEPTTSLDIKISKDIIKLLCQIEDSSLMINVHNLELIPNGKYRIIGIKNKKIMYDGPMSKLSKKLIKELYE